MSDKQRIRLLLADDHEMFRAGLRALFVGRSDVEVVGEAASGEQAVALAGELRPDVVLMDVGMPGLNGIEATRRIRAAHPEVEVLAVTAHDNPTYFFTMLDAGAVGYVLKEGSPSELIQAIHVASGGEAYFSPAVARQLLNDYLRRAKSAEERESFDGLSAREREVLKLVAEGYSNREIADLLVISPNTVEVHRAHVMQKLNLHNRAQLVKYALRSGLIDAR